MVRVLYYGTVVAGLEGQNGLCCCAAVGEWRRRPVSTEQLVALPASSKYGTLHFEDLLTIHNIRRFPCWRAVRAFGSCLLVSWALKRPGRRPGEMRSRCLGVSRFLASKQASNHDWLRRAQPTVACHAAARVE